MVDDLMAKVPENVKQKLAAMADEAMLSTERLVATLLEGFVEGDGKVYTGKWVEGPGIKLLPDWPRSSSKVYRIKAADMQ